MSTKSYASGSRVPVGADPMALDPQQARLLGILARRAGEPVTYDELRNAGIEFPASLISEIELAGVEVDRCFSVRGGHRLTAVRLPAIGAGLQGPPAPQPDHQAFLTQPPAPQPQREHPAPPPPQFEPRRGRRTRLAAPLALIGASAVIASVVLAALSGQTSPAHHRSGAAKAAPLASVPKPARPRPAVAAHAKAGAAHSHLPIAATAPPSASAPAPPSAPPTQAPATPASNTSAGASAPAAAVQAFYENAAAHRYPTAWSLADPNMRAEVGGYAAFEAQMSSVRTISFHELATVASTATSATIAVRTTSVQSNQVQQCWGTVRTVAQAGAWLLDGISIHCA